MSSINNIKKKITSIMRNKKEKEKEEGNGKRRNKGSDTKALSYS